MTEYPAITLPRPPEAPAPYRFPLIATVAPIVLSVVLWFVTGSMMALLFASLGPVTAVAGFVDGRVTSRRSRRRELARFAAEVQLARERIDARHVAESSVLEESHPDAPTIVTRRGSDPARWSTAASAAITVGRATIASSVKTDSQARPGGLSPEVELALDDLESRAEMLPDAPLVADARLGIGLFGPPALTRAAARGFAVQLAWSLSPENFWRARLAPEELDRAWFEQLPHPSGPAVRGAVRYEFGALGSTSAVASIAVAATAAELPGYCRIVIGTADDGSFAVRQHPERGFRQGLQTNFVSLDEAFAWAVEIAQDAERHGLTPPHSAVPELVELTPLLATTELGGVSLSASVALSASGPVALDLVEHGPHAVVGGTTGSGKSELLIAWVVSMAAAHSPERVNFLLVDFKGGSAFGSLDLLPHTVGTITDLDSRGAARALASLRAELSYRERVLADAGARSIEGAPTLPRLVIVVDEFAAMLAEHPDLHTLFADLAARGRSLGVHLVLCTQRPAGVIRDSVLANADLRVSLRVNNPADSTAVVGTDAAAAIPADARGRAIVRLAGAEPQLVQFAQATEADIQSVARRYESTPTPRRPWMEQLPSVVRELPHDLTGQAFGVLDLPHEQRWATAVWRPEADGSVLVLGTGGSGRTTALHALGGDSAVWIPRDADAAWDVLDHLTIRLDSGGEPCTVVLDDLDVLLARFTAEHRAVVMERLTRLLREGGPRGIWCVASATRLNGELLSLASLIPSRLWLRHASRQELVLAGGDSSTHDDKLAPGGGYWQGHRMQAVLRERMPVPQIRAHEAILDPTRPLAIVSTRAGWLAQQLARDNSVSELATLTADPKDVIAARSPRRTIIVGDIDDWQSRWGALAALRPHSEILFHGCAPSDFRALTRSRELPPPLAGDSALCWRLATDGTIARVRLVF